jgi:hypothetical protein
MRPVSYLVTGIASSAEIARAQRPSKRWSLFAILLEALYESRRRKAERILLKYQRLILRAEQRRARELASEGRADDGK